MSADITLRKMTDTEFAQWLDYSINEYAKDKAGSLGIALAEAMNLSRQSFATLLPDGISTADQYFFHVVREGETLGWLWFAIKVEWGVTSAFVYDIEVQPAFRRQGVGVRAMELLETEARVQGAEKIALHVFGQNTGARDLYLKAGYQI